MTHSISSLPPYRAAQFQPEDGPVIHRDHLQCSVEWQIFELHALKTYVQDKAAGDWATGVKMGSPEELPEHLRQSVVIGDGYYSLDLGMFLTIGPRFLSCFSSCVYSVANHCTARTISLSHTPKSLFGGMDSTPGTDDSDFDTLSLYIAALSLVGQSFNKPFTATIFIGVKPVECGIGSRFAATDWVWSTSAEWEFTTENEYWEVQLPLLSTFLERADLAEADSFSLCVQIGSPISAKPSFSLPNQVVIPTSIIDGLAGLLDSSTGDVRFVCLEHSGAPHSSVSGESIGGKTLSKMQTLSRKRVLYAHSEVLKARGEYFAALLMGGFSESENRRRGETRHTTILVDDADFKTVYWVLRFIYTHQLSFADDDDVRLLIDRCHLNAGEITKMLAGAPGYLDETEWDYRHLSMDGEVPEGSVSDGDNDAKTTKSVSSAGTSISRRASDATSSPPTANTNIQEVAAHRTRTVSSVAATVGKLSTISTLSSGSNAQPQPSGSTSSPATPTRFSAAVASPSRRTTPATARGATRSTASKSSSTLGLHKSPEDNPHYRLRQLCSAPDPHHHPTTTPAPASALSVFKLSHRYRIELLENLAKEHILSRMTADNCIPML